MNCPKCNGKTAVVDRRKERRRRECLACQHRFSTLEVLAESIQKPVKTQQVPRPTAQGTIHEKPKKPKQETIKISDVRSATIARRRIEEWRELKELDDMFGDWDVDEP